MSDWQRSQLQCRHEGRQNWLHAKQRTLSERQGPGRERRPKWRLLQGSKLSVWLQNDRIFASLVEWVLRRSFSEHWRKNGVDPRRTTYQSRKPTRQGQTVDLLSVRGQKKKAEMLVAALPVRARTGCTPNKGHSLNDKAPVEKEGQNGGFSKALNWPFGCRTTEFFASLVQCVLRRSFPNVNVRLATFPAAVSSRSPPFWLHAKQRTLSERQGPGRERRPKWRLLQGSKLSVWVQNDRIFASLVECMLRRSFSENWQKNGIDPRPTTYQSRRSTRQGQTVDLLSVRGPKKKAEMLVGALPERVQPRN